MWALTCHHHSPLARPAREQAKKKTMPLSAPEQQLPDLVEVLETLPDPLGLCDDTGALLFCNGAARRLLGLSPEAVVDAALDLGDRATFSHMQLRREGARDEIYLSDVAIDGADALDRVTVTLTRLRGWGGFRARFHEEPELRNRAARPSSRLLQALGGLTGSAGLFEEPDELVALYAAALVEVFPGRRFGLELRAPWLERAPLRHGVLGEAGAERLTRREPEVDLVVTLEVSDGRRRGSTAAEREALGLFLAVLGFHLASRCAEDPKDRAPALDLVAPILHELHALVAICDGRRQLRACNRAFASALAPRSAGPEALVGLDLLELFDEGDTREGLRARIAGVLSGGAVAPLRAEVAALPADPLEADGAPATLLELEIHLAAIDEAAGGFAFIAQPSAASLAELEARYARARELLDVGQLASGVAHELKNPLTSILNYADYLLHKYRDQLFEHRDSERLQRIIDGVERMDRFVRDLVLFARPAEGHDEIISLHDAIGEAAALASTDLELHHAQLELDLRATDPMIRGVRAQLVQVFVNLVLNAAHAMREGGGRVQVSTKSAEDGARLEIEISDDGVGIEAENLERIFEPFFTTKRHEGGSGLGLALVRTIIERHDGAISVRSTPRVGTTFHLALPRHGARQHQVSGAALGRRSKP